MNQTNERFRELDKQVSQQIMKEFKGKAILTVCPHCKNDPRLVKDCRDCKGTGEIKYQY